MQKAIIKTFLILITITSFSCVKKIAPIYLLSQAPTIQHLEKKDHKLCTSLKLNIDGKEDFNSPHYWRCRLSFAKYRLATGQLSPSQTQRNQEISDLITKVSLKVSANSESFISSETKKIDERHHKQCLALGFEFETEDQAKIDEYFICRKSLIEEQQMVPPFGNREYLKYPNQKYTLSYAIDRRIEQAIKKFEKKTKHYPSCAKFGIYNENFTKCTKAQDNSRQCFSKINRKKFKKEWAEKIACQKQAYVRFDDSLIKESEFTKKPKKLSSGDDFASIGIDENLFMSKEENDRLAKEKRAKEKQEKDLRTNSKSGLYTKYELTKLRYKYVKSCQEESNQEIKDFVKKQKQDCEEMKNFEIIGD